MKKTLIWMILGTKGGINRGKIIKLLKQRPYNRNQIANKLNLNYRTITHHLDILEDMNVVNSEGNEYGKLYFLSEEMENEYEEFEEILEQIE